MQKWQFPTGIKRGSSLETLPERHAAEHLTLFPSKGQLYFLKKWWNQHGISASVCHVVEDGPMFDN